MDLFVGTQYFSFCILFALLTAAAAAVLCPLYHMPQALQCTLWQPRCNSSRTASLCGPLLTMRVLIAYACVVCDMIRVCRCLQVCAFVCWNPANQLSHFVCSSCCCRIMPVLHRASSSRALYFVAATVQQQSHSKFVWTTSVRMLALHLYARVMCVCYDT